MSSLVPTPSQTVGPFFGFALPFGAGADAVGPGSPGSIRMEGRLLDGAGDPVPDGLLEAWHGQEFARCPTDAEGAFHFTVGKPVAQGDAAPHLNVAVFARGLLRHLVTRIYFPDQDRANQADPVLARVDPARRETLIARADGEVLNFDIHLQGENETVFFEI